MMAGFDLPSRAIRQQFASAVHLIISAQRLTGGPRKITNITEIQGMEGEVITMQDIFKYEQLGLSPSGKAYGRFMATGLRPSCLDSLRSHGVDLDLDMFERSVLSEDKPE